MGGPLHAPRRSGPRGSDPPPPGCDPVHRRGDQLALRQGDLSGIEAFERGQLKVRGNLDHAIAFEGLFRLPGGRPPLLRVHEVRTGRNCISTLTMGHGPDVLLLHGLGGTRASRFQRRPSS